MTSGGPAVRAHLPVRAERPPPEPVPGRRGGADSRSALLDSRRRRRRLPHLLRQSGALRLAPGVLRRVVRLRDHLLPHAPGARRRADLPAQIFPRPLVAAIVFFFGGAIGWALASLVAQATGLTRIDFSAGHRRGPDRRLIGLFGLVFFFFGVLQERLRESVARLKEAEFAEKELELARSIQRRLLPPDAIEGDGFRVSARNLPARFVAGDFYDVFHLADGRSASSSRTSPARGSAPRSSWRPSRPSFPSSPPAARPRRLSST